MGWFGNVNYRENEDVGWNELNGNWDVLLFVINRVDVFVDVVVDLEVKDKSNL